VTLSPPPEARVPDPALRGRVEDFLYDEAALLDAGELEEWLSLWSDDGVYWIPIGEGTDSDRNVSIAYDDRARLEDRIWRLRSGEAHAQLPPSRVNHLLGNVRLLAARESVVEVESRFVVAEIRRERQALYCGRYIHHLVIEEGSQQLRIRRKEVYLATSELALGNLGFIF
jgi:benzoate/toluate 1,2-dioxygenase beta subunit